MNEQQLQRSERIASQIMRGLAMVGAASLLALVAWLIVQGVRQLSSPGGMGAAVGSVQSWFRSAPEASLTFELATRTLVSGEPITVAWQHTGATGNEQSYSLSHTCVTGASFEVKEGDAWKELLCNTPYTTDHHYVLVRPRNTASRFADVELSVSGAGLSDTTLVTIMQAKAATATTTAVHTVATNPARASSTTTTTTTTAKPVVTVKRPVETQTPGDLVLNIAETGILVRSGGKDVFFPVSPIPTTKTAAVTFTVTNRGGSPSGAWAFIARLPIEGDSDYKYVSPAQSSLAPNTEVLFTLGFDEVLEAKSGTIRIEIVPASDTDNSANNEDAVKVALKK